MCSAQVLGETMLGYIVSTPLVEILWPRILLNCHNLQLGVGGVVCTPR